MVIYSLILTSCLLELVWGLNENCNYNHKVYPNKLTYLNVNTKDFRSCQYKYTAPIDHYIEMKCNISLPSTNGQCETDSFWVHVEGDMLLPGAEKFCGTLNIYKVSLFTEIVVSYISMGSSSGEFKCSLIAKPQKCDCGWPSKPRITNGENATDTEFPSMAALRDTTRPSLPSFCGGAIVSHRHIITAAHCLTKIVLATNIQAIVGTDNLTYNSNNPRYYQKYNIIEMLSHEEYKVDKSGNMYNDIAVLKTGAHIKWNRGVGPICLPLQNNANIFPHDTVDVIGYGTIAHAGRKSSTLQKINLWIGLDQDCQQQFNEINTNHICTYDSSGKNRDSCQFDSGGPVIRRLSKQYLVGIISFGNGCGKLKYGVNTRVTQYIQWIREKIDNSNCVVSM